ncbi:MAG: hypothetical protein K1X66_00575 [Verrucomicrobiae bacterium]|nr:hypothetical protein [Verrucomicrobiae bacterium]
MKTQTMKDKNQTLKQYVTDMRALDQYLLDITQTQAKDENLKRYPQAVSLINQIVFISQKHVASLDIQVTRFNVGTRSAIKGTVTSIAGSAMGLINKMRSHEVSKMLRDDYTTLSISAISYTMLHTVGLALHDSIIADLALEHLKNITPLVVEISEITPAIVVTELADEGDMVEPNVGMTALRNTQQAWTKETSQAV